MSDISRPKLSLKPKDPSSEELSPRRRTGARAHRVAKSTHNQSPKATPPLADRPVKSSGTRSNENIRKPRPASDYPKRTQTARVPQQAPLLEGNSPHRQYKGFAPCPQGLEGVLAQELTAIGLAQVAPARAGVHFVSDWAGILKANLYSRIATRILVQLVTGPINNEQDLYELTRSINWEKWFGAEQTLRVDTSAIRSPMQSLQFCNLKVKDAICDYLRDKEGARPNIDTVRPDARVHAFLTETDATIYLDTSGESLFKRGWRLDKGDAPLRENLAAGILALADWQPHQPLIDPFCGSGTLLIEAACKALNIAPGLRRPFSFERLRYHPHGLWKALREQARESIKNELEAPIAGTDIDRQTLNAALANADRAGLLDDQVYFEEADARAIFPLDERPGLIITNPPYGERLTLMDEEQLWQEWATTLKQKFGGWQVFSISSDRDLPKKMRLQSQLKTPLYNGAIECRLFKFDIVVGSFRDH